MPPAPEIASLAFHQVTDEPASTGFQWPGAVPFALTRQTFARCLGRIQASDSSPALVTDFDLTRPARHFLLTLDGGGKRAGPFLPHHEPDRYPDVPAEGGNPVPQLRALDRQSFAPHPDTFRELTPSRMLEKCRVSSDLLRDFLGVPCLTAWGPLRGGPPRRVSADTCGYDIGYLRGPWDHFLPSRYSETGGRRGPEPIEW
jgi:hypothetical protein